MHSHTGSAAALATAILSIGATPAAADPRPDLSVPAIDLTLNVGPRSPKAAEPEPTATATATPTRTRTTPAATKPASTTKPTSAAPIKSALTTTRAQAETVDEGDSARQTSSRSPAPSPASTVLRVVHEPSTAAGPVDRSASRPLWLDLIAALAPAVVAVFAMALMSRRGRPTVPDPVRSPTTAEQWETAREVVDGDAIVPEGIDPEAIAAARRIARRLDER